MLLVAAVLGRFRKFMLSQSMVMPRVTMARFL
jgi:hypothetical protein